MANTGGPLYESAIDELNASLKGKKAPKITNNVNSVGQGVTAAHRRTVGLVNLFAPIETGGESKLEEIRMSNRKRIALMLAVGGVAVGTVLVANGCYFKGKEVEGEIRPPSPGVVADNPSSVTEITNGSVE